MRDPDRPVTQALLLRDPTGAMLTEVCGLLVGACFGKAKHAHVILPSARSASWRACTQR
jgi:hypothetical protein